MTAQQLIAEVMKDLKVDGRTTAGREAKRHRAEMIRYLNWLLEKWTSERLGDQLMPEVKVVNALPIQHFHQPTFENAASVVDIHGDSGVDTFAVKWNRDVREGLHELHTNVPVKGNWN